MNIEKYSCYEFRIEKCIVMEDIARTGYYYEIYDPERIPCGNSIIREAQEWFETEQEARFAAIGHINLLENGEG